MRGDDSKEARARRKQALWDEIGKRKRLQRASREYRVASLNKAMALAKQRAAPVKATKPRPPGAVPIAFVIRCPDCGAPQQDHARSCEFCDVPLVWGFA